MLNIMVLEIILFMLTDCSIYIYYGTPISDEMRDKIVSPISLLNICMIIYENASYLILHLGKYMNLLIWIKEHLLFNL